MRTAFVIVPVLFVAGLSALALSGCEGGNDAAPADGGADADADADGDGDSDSDSDGDGDGDSDADTDADTDADGGADGDTDADSDADTDADTDTDTEPECTDADDCPEAGQECYLGFCRDTCNWLLNPCDWAPSGNVCHGGFCVECEADADCPGTRYACDTSTFLCVDEPFDPSLTKIGVFYHTWHCPSAADVHDVTRCLAGDEDWPPWPADTDAQTSFWWGEPEAGYYCLTGNTALLTQHAGMLRDMGADFVFVDVTNHNYNTGALCAQPEEMIVQPFTSLVDVWKTIPGAPKIVPWVPVSDCPTYLSPDDCDQPDGNYMVYTLLDLLEGTGLAFEHDGKPLLLVAENGTYPVSDARVAALSIDYTIRRMWAFEPEGTEDWSYLERCDADPLEGQPCDQRISVSGGAGEQFPIATAYGADYMSHTATATPKHYGKTFRKQFQTLLDNPEIPIATITGWNEWIVGRWHCGSPACDCGSSFDATYGCFLDQYTDEYNRDIEPANNATGDYYYLLVQNCIDLFRAGKRCTDDNAGELCCSDYPG